MKNFYLKSVLFVQLLVFVLVAVVALFLFRVPCRPFLFAFSFSCLVSVVYSLSTTHFYFSALKKDALSMARFYMIHMMLRFVVCGAVILLFTQFLSTLSRAYLIGFCFFFLLTLVGESFIFIHIEKKLKENKINE